MLIAPVVLAVAVYFYLTGGRYQSTDDAYTQAATVSISSNVAGRVLEIYVHDNEIVKRGDSLYRLDDAPFRIAVSDAEAKLASTRLQIASLKSTYRQKQVELQSARDTLAYAQRQFDRNYAPPDVRNRLAGAVRSGIERVSIWDISRWPMPSRASPSRSPISAATRISLPSAIRWSSKRRRPWTARGSICRIRSSRRRPTGSSPRSSSCRWATTSRPRRPCSPWCRRMMCGSRRTSRRRSSTACGRDKPRPWKSTASAASASLPRWRA